jgi:hypothetical protein
MISRPVGPLAKAETRPSTTNVRKKKAQRTKNHGPGMYEIDKAIVLTKPKTPAVKIAPSGDSRPKTFAPPNAYQGVEPGRYTIGKEFGSDAKPFKIGVKRPKVVQKSPGPGDYEPDRAIIQVKSKSPTANFGKSKSPSRPDSSATSG